MGLMAKEECLIFHLMVFLWNSSCPFSVPLCLFCSCCFNCFNLSSSLQSSCSVCSPPGVLLVRGCPEQGDGPEVSAQHGHPASHSVSIFTHSHPQSKGSEPGLQEVCDPGLSCVIRCVLEAGHCS